MIPAARLALVYIIEFVIIAPKYGDVTYLSNHTLRDLSWVKTIIETKSSNMGVGTNSFDPSEVLDLLHLRVNSGCRHEFV